LVRAVWKGVITGTTIQQPTTTRLPSYFVQPLAIH